ncbi:MAG TPA: 30S ribosomal protein S8 [Actinomycetota bacterium]|nr:30S ribosomal protein S8 [Actinomycetota bacterium]
MVMTDPVADLLTRLRNASMSYKEEITIPSSSLKERITEILAGEGYLAETAVEGEGKDRRITVRLKYGPNRERTITGLKRISRPGRRVFAGRGDIPRVRGGLGIAILSTSQGLMTDRQAKKLGIGGEVLAYVW